MPRRCRQDDGSPSSFAGEASGHWNLLGATTPTAIGHNANLQKLDKQPAGRKVAFLLAVATPLPGFRVRIAEHGDANAIGRFLDIVLDVVQSVAVDADETTPFMRTPSTGMWS
jgi:hypothetical protein